MGDLIMNAENIDEYDFPLKPSLLNNEFNNYVHILMNNLNASLSNVRGMWDLFMDLDTIYVNIHQDLGISIDQKNVLSLSLFMLSQRFMRSSTLLIFSTQLMEGLNVARMGIESAISANKISVDPSLFYSWVQKDKGKKKLKEFNNIFRYERWEGHRISEAREIKELKKLWDGYSNYYTHPTISGAGNWMDTSDFSEENLLKIASLEGDEELIVQSIYSVLKCFTHIEILFFNSFETRLKFDTNLIDKINKYNIDLENIRKSIATKYKIGHYDKKPPEFFILSD